MNHMLDLIRILGYYATVAFNSVTGFDSLNQIADEPLPFSGVFSSNAWLLPMGGLCGKPSGLPAYYLTGLSTHTALPTRMTAGADSKSQIGVPK